MSIDNWMAVFDDIRYVTSAKMKQLPYEHALGLQIWAQRTELACLGLGELTSGDQKEYVGYCLAQHDRFFKAMKLHVMYGRESGLLDQKQRNGSA